MIVFKFIDLFAGIGGFHRGFQEANKLVEKTTDKNAKPIKQGIKRNRRRRQQPLSCVWANDNNKYTSQIDKKRFPNTPFQEGDIESIDLEQLPSHDLLCAGFPCQAFSIAGKRKGFDDTRGTLFFEIARILEAKRPKLVLLENVKGLLSHNQGRTFAKIIQTLDELGYWVEWQVLNSKDFGVPQNRERVFIAGHFRGKGRRPIFPLSQSHENSENIGTSKEACAVIQSYCKGGQGNMIQIGQLDNNSDIAGRIYSPNGLSKTLSFGGGQGAKTGLYKVAQAIQTDGMLRQGNSFDTNAPQSSRNIRRLTPTECERLQGFPDGWTNGISDTQRYKCLGNAVTVNVVREIGIKILGLGI